MSRNQKRKGTTGSFVETVLKKQPVVLWSVFLFTVVLITYAVLSWWKKEGFAEENETTPVVFKLFIYETSTEPNRTHNMEKLLQYFHYPYKIVGGGDEWNSWYGRLKKYREALDEMADDDYVMFSDGRDVLPNEEYSVFIQKAVALNKEKNGAIIFNAESYCCNVGSEFKGNALERNIYVHEIMDFFEKNAPQDTEDYYLNFGLIFGKCRDLKEMFDLMDIQPDYDDQGLIARLITEKKFTHYYLDYNKDLFAVMFKEPKWNEERKGFQVPDSSAFPSFYHFPGKTEWYVPCSKKMLKTHLQEEAILDT